MLEHSVNAVSLTSVAILAIFILYGLSRGNRQKGVP